MSTLLGNSNSVNTFVKNGRTYKNASPEIDFSSTTVISPKWKKPEYPSVRNKLNFQKNVQNTNFLCSASGEEKEFIDDEKINLIGYEAEIIKKRERLRISGRENKNGSENENESVGIVDYMDDDRRLLRNENICFVKELNTINDNNEINNNKNYKEYSNEKNNENENYDKNESERKDVQERLEWEDEDVHSSKDDSSFSTSTVSSTSFLLFLPHIQLNLFFHHQ